MNFKYKLSIIVPCYNSSNTIGRLIDSVVNNDLTKDEYELIIVDDNSTDNFMNIVKRYEDKANIAYYKTNTNVHCPGNTRQVGLDNAKGEWITFIDHDDYFEPNIFRKVFNTLKKNHITTMLSTAFYAEYDNNEKVPYSKEDEHIGWLHGKFYNHQMLIDGNINFKKDLESHEDIYFNNLIKGYSLINSKPLNFTNELFTYNWVQSESSLSHYLKDGATYLDIHYDDFMYASFEPLFLLPDSFRKYKLDNLLYRFLIFYFVYQQGVYKLGDYYPKHWYNNIRDLKNRIYKEFGITDDIMIKLLYSSPEFYHEMKIKTFTNIGEPFIEYQSLSDFIKSLK